jgi:fucose permease
MEAKRSPLTAVVALTAVFSLAICFIIIGSVSVELQQALGIDESRIGTLVLALFLTSTIVQFFIGPLVDKVGHKPVVTVGFLVTAASMFLLGLARSYALALWACIFLGIGAMCLNTVGNTLIPQVLFGGKDPARASNLGNAFFGLGYVLTPLLVVLFLRVLGLSYASALAILGVLMLVFLVISLLASYPRAEIGFQLSMAARLLGHGAVLIAALALFCYIALESSMGTWIKPYMTETLGGAENPSAAANAGLVLSLFGVAMMVGRFLTSTVKNLTAIGTKVITAVSIVAALSILVMRLTGRPAVAILAVIITGLVFAPIFPTIVGVTFAKYEPRLYGSIFGIIFAIGLLGGTIVPKLIGNLSAGSSVRASLSIAVAMAVILFVISLFLGKAGRPEPARK